MMGPLPLLLGPMVRMLGVVAWSCKPPTRSPGCDGVVEADGTGRLLQSMATALLRMAMDCAAMAA